MYYHTAKTKQSLVEAYKATKVQTKHIGKRWTC